ncbi:hypothetical protein [Mesorhizobium xinjiangense]|uniref:hypothetical protein n=1 Tax=Mesorhizobium xinjiangense TaxID=2678685 RepID=UPI0012ECE99D|nr:hypothetical protein [Mesorhizobium xinjiangense]
MTDTMIPIIRQMHEAEDDRARARALLIVSDQVLMKYRHVYEDACRRVGFDLGLRFIDVRRAAWHAIRSADGTHKNPLFEEVRASMAEFAGSGE